MPNRCYIAHPAKKKVRKVDWRFLITSAIVMNVLCPTHKYFLLCEQLLNLERVFRMLRDVRLLYTHKGILVAYRKDNRFKSLLKLIQLFYEVNRSLYNLRDAVVVVDAF